MRRRKIASHYALINGRLERNIIIEVEERTITAIEQTENIDNRAGVEFYPGILIAGMVNAHCHLELAYLRGAIAEGSGFAGFASAIGRVRNNFTTEERLRAASVADAQMWEEGIEAVADIANDHLVMPIKEHSAIRYHTFIEFFGHNNHDIESARKMASGANCSLTPHSIYSVQDEPFRTICAEGNAPISLHFLESDDEKALYSGHGSLHDWYERQGWRCDFLHYGTPTERVARNIPNDRRMLLIHNVKATTEDVAMLNEHFTNGLFWVLCPESNRFISRTEPPVDMLRKKRVKIAIGTASLASARHLSMVMNMSLLGDIPLEELLIWATRNGAEALGLETTLGDLRIGTAPGIVLIEGADLQNMRLTSETRSRRII